jgi:hypothetical protein
MFAFRKNPFKSDSETAETYTNNELNYSFRRPDKSWAEDKGLKSRLSISGFAQKRSKPDAWIALHTKIFGNRNPRPGEMRGEMLDMLRRFKGLERTDFQDTVDGQPADAVRFTGELEGTQVTGMGFAFHYKGIGYILLTFATLESWDSVSSELEGLRKSFAFAKNREDWHETEAAIVEFTIPNGNYELRDVDGVWERAIVEAEDDPLDPMPKKSTPKKGAYVLKTEDLKAKDPLATMAFRAFKKVKAKFSLDQRPMAEALVLVFDKAEGEPLETVRSHWLAKLNRDDGGEGVEITLKPLDKTPTGAALPKSEASLGIFQSTHSQDRGAKRFIAISVLKIGDKLVATVAWCRDRDAEDLGPYVLDLAASLRERK